MDHKQQNMHTENMRGGEGAGGGEVKKERKVEMERERERIDREIGRE